MTKAEEFKQRGNQAFSQGDFSKAIDEFSKAIDEDGRNYVLYSNRSAAYASRKQFSEALEDGEKVVELAPNWAKGYGRKAAALVGLHRYEEARQVYTKGLELDPENAALKQGISEIPEIPKQFNPFATPEALDRVRTNKSCQDFFSQPDFVAAINEISQNPSSLSKYVRDTRIMQAAMVAMGIDLSSIPAKESAPVQHEETPKPAVAELSQEEQHRELGNQEYKKRNFEKALEHYQAALELNPTSVKIMLNQSAVFFEQGNYNSCIDKCKEALKHGREQVAEFQTIAKIYSRMGSAYLAQKEYDPAIEHFKKSLLEHRTAPTLGRLREAERLKEQETKRQRHDPKLSDEERNLGNELFKKQDYVQALKHYSESIRRNEGDPRGYSNRAACYAKLMAYTDAISDCDTCIKLDPKFVKAYIRKAAVLYSLKDYQQCLRVCLEAQDQDVEGKHGLEIDSQIGKCYAELDKINQDKSPEDKLKDAMKDPEVASILGDPVMQQILSQMQNDPGAVAEHMRNPLVASKLRKLVAAGIVKVGHV